MRTWPTARLTASETGELDLARAHLRALVTAAGAVVAAAGHAPDLGACADAGCRLAVVEEGPRLCALAHRLVLVAPDPVSPGEEPWTDGAVAQGDGAVRLEPAVAAFRVALVESLDAVRTCRSVGHAEGHCWFAPALGAGGCGEVLRVAHRVS